MLRADIHTRGDERAGARARARASVAWMSGRADVGVSGVRCLLPLYCIDVSKPPLRPTAGEYGAELTHRLRSFKIDRMKGWDERSFVLQSIFFIAVILDYYHKVAHGSSTAIQLNYKEQDSFLFY